MNNLYTRRKNVKIIVITVGLATLFYFIAVVSLKLKPSWKSLGLLIAIIAVILILRETIKYLKIIFEKFEKKLPVKGKAIYQTISGVLKILFFLVCGALIYKGFNSNFYETLGACLAVGFVTINDIYQQNIKRLNES